MKLTSLELQIKKKIEAEITHVAPGLILQVHKSARKQIDIQVGETYPYYDLASLTKIIFTTQAMMKAFDLGLWNLESRISEKLSWFPHPEIKVIECLNHSSGLIWWRPFYSEMDLALSREEKWQILKEKIATLPLEKKPESVYSDVGFLVLGFYLEELFQKDLLSIWQQVKSDFYSAGTFDFHVQNEPKNQIQYYAPTESCLWRKKIIQGEVHDDNTWALGGVAPHAGLFGSIHDLGWYALLLRSQFLGLSRTLIKSKTAQMFATRSRPQGRGDWGLGFAIKSEKNSLLGERLSQVTFGHWGFTGTSVWYDPKNDISVCILSNRTLYGREKKDFSLLRPKIHNWVMESLLA